MSVGDIEAGTWTSQGSAVRTRQTAGATRRTVLIALAANVAVAITKLAGGLLSGSAAMLAEAAHSLADSVNQGLLLGSIGLAAREATPEHPFGYGTMRFLWTFVAAIATFLAGAIFAVGYGVYRLSSASGSGGYLVAYIALGISLVAEGSSWLRAVHQTRKEANQRQLPLLQYVRESRDPNVKMVVFEDTAALVGIGLAFAGILADQLTGSSVFDPAASIAIGLLLVSVGVRMGYDTSQLLVGAAARPAERVALERALEEFGQVKQVFKFLTIVLGPNSLLVAARIDFADGLREGEIEQASDDIDRRLREVVPDVTEVFLDATRPEPTDGQRQVSAASPGAH